MAGSSKSATTSRTEKDTNGLGEVVGQIVRNAAGEAVKGGSSVAETTRRVVSDAVETLDEKGPELAGKAGILTWRYAVLGWATWNVGKFVVKRRARKAVKETRRKASRTTRRN